MYRTFCRSSSAGGFILLIVSLFSAPLAEARHGGEAHQPGAAAASPAADIQVLPGEAVLLVHGIVCSFCAQGVARNIARLPFIDPDKYTAGVKVEIEQQRVTVAIKPAQQIDLDALFKAIIKGGYEPVQAYVRDTAGDVYAYKPQGAPND